MPNIVTVSTLTRGLRNNNPGNLIRTSDGWQGKVPFAQSTDTKFEQFYALPWGLRALMKDLQTKISKGTNTITKIISVFAPNNENNTSAYIANVASNLGMSATAVLANNKDVIIAISKAIVLQENGSIAASKIAASDYENAWFILQSGYQYGSGDLPELTLNSDQRCKYCGHALVILALFFFTYFTISM